ncbi:lipopolysaccharide biosynthesis protein [Pseudomonas sp.]|uniref:lipopolysaccharide biosynthesis protein n=1 Tax=Pseudomonas sp. TaxID=306 RepID=UPI00272B3786|nr:lipopolysaccharide biosynthesis protein [Pseudomonas sp.]
MPVKVRIKQLASKPFLRNVIILASGTAGAQAINMAFVPFITRLYGPEAYGVLGTFLALVAVLAPVAALCYPIAIVLPRQDRDARTLARLSFYLSLGFALLLLAMLLGWGEPIAGLLNVQGLGWLLFLLPLAALFGAWLQIIQQWLIRKQAFGVSARAALAQAVIQNLAKVGIGLMAPLAGVLIALATFGALLHTALLWLGGNRAGVGLAQGSAVSGEVSRDARLQTETQASATPAPEPAEQHSTSTLKSMARKYYDFPLYRAPQVLVNSVSQSLPILVLAALVGPAAAGFYTLGKTVMGMPSLLVGKAVQDVFYPRITEAAHRGESLRGLIVKATAGLAAVGALPFGLVVAFGPWLFQLVFGSEWSGAGEYARWLAVWFFFGFLNRPSVAAIATLSLQGFFLVYEVTSVLLRVAALFVGFSYFGSDLVAIALFSVVGAVLNTVLVLVTIFRG